MRWLEALLLVDEKGGYQVDLSMLLSLRLKVHMPGLDILAVC
jgi:hypothetical protein